MLPPRTRQMKDRKKTRKVEKVRVENQKIMENLKVSNGLQMKNMTWKSIWRKITENIWTDITTRFF